LQSARRLLKKAARRCAKKRKPAKPFDGLPEVTVFLQKNGELGGMAIQTPYGQIGVTELGYVPV